MAINDNTVPLGREGTGAAQILGPNRALQQFLSTNQNTQNRLLQEQQRFQQKQEAYDGAFQKEMMGLNELAVSPMYQQDLAQLTNALIKQGSELRSKGINPYNPNQSPEAQAAVQQWQSEVNKVKQAKLIADNLYQQRQDLVKKYNANPASFDIDEYKKIVNFDKENSLLDVMENGTQLPTLEEIPDVGKMLTTKYGEVYSQGTVQDVDANGNPIRREVKEADMPRIANIVRNEFTEGTPYANNVNRLLRKEFGDGASISGLLRTTNRDEIRSILDAQFRNDTSDANPIVELMSKGKVPSLNSQEYNEFLDKATDEQLKAEKILDQQMQYAANSLIGKVNTRDTWKFDFTLRNQKLKEDAAARSARNSDLSARNTLLSIQKKLTGGDDEDDDLITDANDVDFSTENNPNAIKVWGAIPLNTSSFSINPANATDVNTGSKVKTKSIRGGISGVGLVGYDKNGKVINGATPEEVMNNPNVVSFKPQVIIQDSKSRSRNTYDVKDIPLETLPKTVQGKIKKVISIQEKAASELNKNIKSKSQTLKPVKNPIVNGNVR